MVVEKKKDPSAITIPCTIRMLKFEKALCDLIASINLMRYSIYQKIVLGVRKPTTMILLMVDHSIKKSVGVLYDVLVKVDQFTFLMDFIIFNYEIDHEIPIIINSTFLAIGRALVGIEYG